MADNGPGMPLPDRVVTIGSESESYIHSPSQSHSHHNHISDINELMRSEIFVLIFLTFKYYIYDKKINVKAEQVTE